MKSGGMDIPVSIGILCWWGVTQAWAGFPETGVRDTFARMQ